MKIRTQINQIEKAFAFMGGRGRAHLAAMARRIVLSFVLAATAGFAYAADLPSKANPPVFAPPPPPAFDWTGFYVGVNAGYGLDHFAFPYIVTNGPFLFQGRDGITARGPLGGIQAGFNYQFPFGLVLGVEIDNSWSGIRGQTTANGEQLPAGFGSATFGSRFEDFATARGRIGYALDRFLVYFTGGATVGTVNTYYSAATTAPYYGTTPFLAAGSSAATRSGLLPHVGVIGIGGEYAIANNLTVKAEYLYDFINARNTSFTTNGGLVNFGTRTMYHIARVGLNYKFDWLSPPPVVAKY